MKDKIQLLHEMIAGGNGEGKAFQGMMLDVLAELAMRIETVESENARLRETMNLMARGGKPVATGGPNGFSIG